MRRRVMVALLGLAALSGCVPSINPLYTDKELVVDPALPGACRSGAIDFSTSCRMSS